MKIRKLNAAEKYELNLDEDTEAYYEVYIGKEAYKAVCKMLKSKGLPTSKVDPKLNYYESLVIKY